MKYAVGGKEPHLVIMAVFKTLHQHDTPRRVYKKEALFNGRVLPNCHQFFGQEELVSSAKIPSLGFARPVLPSSSI